jgi:hypothetical protein
MPKMARCLPWELLVSHLRSGVQRVHFQIIVYRFYIKGNNNCFICLVQMQDIALRSRNKDIFPNQFATLTTEEHFQFNKTYEDSSKKNAYKCTILFHLTIIKVCRFDDRTI